MSQPMRKTPTGAVPTQEDVATEVRALRDRVNELGVLVENRWPELGAHYSLNGAWRKLDEVEHRLSGRGQRR